MNPQPTLADLRQLREQHARALGSLDRVRWEGGGPVYPGEINELMRQLSGKIWNIPYDTKRTTATLADLPNASLDDIRNLFTHITRSERFNSGVWQDILEGGVPLPEIFDRLEVLLTPKLEQEKQKPPITHPLGITAFSLAGVWAALAVLPILLAFVVEYLRTHGYIGRGNAPTPLYIVVVLFLLGVIFNLILGVRGARELALIRRGGYLAHWPALGGDRVAHEYRDTRRKKTLLLLFLPVVALGFLGLLGGAIGAYMKSDLDRLWQFGGGGLAFGLGLGMMLAVPAWFILGVRIRHAENLPSEIIFTPTGFYRPGQFIPVTSWPRPNRKVALLHSDKGSMGPRLVFELRSSYSTVTGRPGGGATRHDFPVPPGRESEAASLAEHYREAQ